MGALNQVVITTAIVMHPPNTTDGTMPISFAARPLSNCPSSLEELIKMLLTDIILPRNSSGDFNCRMVPLIIMLTPSKIPLNSKAMKETHAD